MSKEIFKAFILIIVCSLNISLTQAQKSGNNSYAKRSVIKASDVLHPMNSSDVKIEGFIGRKLDSCIQNGVMSVNYTLYSIPFKDKTDKGGMFQGEFWGKWFTSAILAESYHPSKENSAIVNSSLKELIDTQESDGRISSYPRDETFINWDIWGRKYALLGLMSYYESHGDKKVLEAACKAADELINIAGPGKQKLTETGLRVLGSMSSTSILEPLVLIYENSGQQKYLDFASYMVSLWSEPNAYTDKGMRLVEDALECVPPALISSPKAYETMSCFEGLCEMYRATGDSIYLKSVLAYAESLLDREIMIVGSGSSSELWCDGVYKQTELLEQPMETCVTITWLKFCYQLLRLTGDTKWADQMEITLYNALLGAMNESGDWWAYFSQLAGERMPSPMQVPTCESSCCVANGPRGLLTVPGWSVMTNDTETFINLYTSGTWNRKLKDGTKFSIEQITDYPEGEVVEIVIHTKKKTELVINFRIPEWSKETEIRVNGESFECSAGSYCKIKRNWKEGDKINLKLDMRGRIIQSKGNVNSLAVMRGPVVLALDNRMVEAADYNLWLYPEDTKWTSQDELGGVKYVLPHTVSTKAEVKYIDLKPVVNKPDNVWMAFEVPFLYKYTHFFNHEVKSLQMCDYASAGNQYTEENLFRVWIPQPLFMNYIFPEDTWKILYREGEKRPVFPERLKPGILGNPWEK